MKNIIYNILTKTKIIITISISLLFLATIIAFEPHNKPLEAYAQTTNKTINQQTDQPPSLSPLQRTINQSQMMAPSNLSTFVAGGNIGSENRNQTSNHILTGSWEVAVVNGTLQGFVSEFTMVQVDGSDRNTMTILKIISGNSSNITLQPQGNTIMIGNFDVAQNGNLKWSKTPAEITIHKTSTISIMFNDQVVKDHFGEEPIYGTVGTIFDPVGKRVVLLQ
jgi:hypothetical protein